MSADDELMLGPLPARRFLKRRIKYMSKEWSKKGVPVWLVNIKDDMLEVQPHNHRGTILIEASQAAPWWSQNPDLKQMLMDSADTTQQVQECRPYGCMCEKCVTRYLAEAEAQDAEFGQAEEEATEPEPEPEPEMQAATHIIPVVMPDPPRLIKQPRMVISEDVDPAWMEVYAEYIQKCRDEQAAQDILRDAQLQLSAEHAAQDAIISRLSAMGVSIIKDTVTESPHANTRFVKPTKTKPKRALSSVERGRELRERIEKWAAGLAAIARASASSMIQHIPRRTVEVELGVNQTTLERYMHDALRQHGLRVSSVKEPNPNIRGRYVVILKVSSV